jgi:tetratricopeptide (TPR) repeat protein
LLALGEPGFDEAKTSVETTHRLSQRILGRRLEPACEIGEREQQVSKFGLHFGAIAPGNGRVELRELLADFCSHPSEVGPIETLARSLLPHALSPQKCRRILGDPVDGRRSRLAARDPFLALELGPPPLDVRHGLSLVLAEDVRMAPGELVCDGGGDVGHGEGPAFLGDARLKDDLKEEVAELDPQLGEIPRVEGVHDFVGLLDQIGTQRLEILFPVPGASIRGAQPPHDVQKPDEGIPGPAMIGIVFSHGGARYTLGPHRMRSRFAANTLWTASLLLTLVGSASLALGSVDAVDESEPGEAVTPKATPANPPPRTAPARVRQQRKAPEPDSSEREDAEEEKAVAEPPVEPARAEKPEKPEKKVEADKADKKVDAGAAATPAATATAPASVQHTTLTPIVLPHGSLADLLSHFRARQTAILEQDPRKAEVEAKALRELKVELGFPDFRTVGQALVREGQRRLDGHLGVLARSAAQLATDLSPGLPEGWWLLARSELSADGVSGLPAAGKAVLMAVRAEVQNPVDRRALFGNLAVSALWAALAALAVALALLAASSLRYALHDFHHLFPKGASPIQTGLLGLILLAVPWLFGLGPFAIMASLALAIWIYLDRQGQIVVGLAIALLVLSPLLLSEVAARTAVSPLALDLWTAETDLDAEAAESRLLALTQEKNPNVATLAVLGQRAKRLGHLDEAEGFYRRALQIAPNRADFENNLGNVRLLKGDLPGAKLLYEAAIDHDPARAAAYFNLGQDFSRMVQLDQSQEAQRHALELDRPLIEQHMSAPSRANQFLIDSDIVFSDVASLGSTSDLAPRGVRQQAERKLFGAFAPVWIPATLLLALLLGVFKAARRRLHPSEACRKCGRPVCQRCDPGLPGEGLCGQCVNVFLRKSVADPPARIRKEAKVKAYQAFRLRAIRGLGVLLGGGGHILLGEVALGTALLFGLALFLTLATRVAAVLRPPELGIVLGVAALVSAVLLIVLYLIALRDLFSKTR